MFIDNLYIFALISQSDISNINGLTMILKITAVLNVSTYIITSITVCPIRLAVICNIRDIQNLTPAKVQDREISDTRLKSYMRVSQISLSCNFCWCLILFLTFISCFQFRVCLCTFNRRSCKQCELFPLHVNQKGSSVFLCIA